MLATNGAEEVIQVKDRFYILASSSLADSRTQVLKHDESFGVFDRHGDIECVGRGALGLYHQDTRFLSHCVLKLYGERPMLLSSAVKEDNILLAVDLTNSDVMVDGGLTLPRGTIHLSRELFLWNSVLYQRITVSSYSLSPVSVSMSLALGSDFADLFEVRGTRRERRGRTLPAAVENGEVVLAYEGLDGVTRCTRIQCSPNPARVEAAQLQFELQLRPQGCEAFLVTTACAVEPAPDAPSLSVADEGRDEGHEACRQGRFHALPRSFEAAYQQAEGARKASRSQPCRMHTSNEQFNDWLNRATADLQMLVTDTPEGPYPYAGVPWFNTAFGRDGIITALEVLWLEPALARGVLAYLASTQATETDPQADAEPGKILHETRQGEMAALKEVPFARYYGSVDATPLFVILAGAYFARTSDRALIENLWPHIEAALSWIDHYGDRDGDGFVEYSRHSATGLAQQGWKDSQDSVFHADGTLAEPPIALSEVQGYVYAARQQAAELAEAIGRPEQAASLRAQASRLRDQFENAFWCGEISAYALALDGQKRQCQVRTSNAAQCLFTGIASPAHACTTAQTMLQDDMFTGWGIRTVSSAARRYNPMSYHNGSVWPHDNALIAWGMGRYGLGECVGRVFTGLFDAAIFVELHRLPELFCGFARRPGEGPTLYPVACSPQAWAAASVFMLLGACLGISISAAPPQIHFQRAFLPESVPEIQITNLKVGNAAVDLAVSRYKQNVSINIMRREGAVEIISVK